MSWGWVEITEHLLIEYCQVCGKAVKPKGKGSHRRKHPDVDLKVCYGLLPPDISCVFLTVGYTPEVE